MLGRDIAPAGLILVQFVGMPEIPVDEDDDEHGQHYADDHDGGAQGGGKRVFADCPSYAPVSDPSPRMNGPDFPQPKLNCQGNEKQIAVNPCDRQFSRFHVLVARAGIRLCATPTRVPVFLREDGTLFMQGADILPASASAIQKMGNGVDMMSDAFDRFFQMLA